MRLHPTGVTIACLLVLPLTLRAEANSHPSRLLLDDFETDSKGWTYIDGREFPGAQGGFALDAADAHGGKRSYKLQADFSGGGAYVGVWRDLSALKGRDVNELRLWVKAVNVTSIGVRLSDNTEQCYQTNGVKLVGYANMPSRIAADASALYAKNLFAFLGLIIDPETKGLKIDLADEIIKGTLVTRDGAIVHPALAPAETPAA